MLVSRSMATGLRLEVSMTARCIPVWPRRDSVLSHNHYGLVLHLVTPMLWYLMAVLSHPWSCTLCRLLIELSTSGLMLQGLVHDQCDLRLSADIRDHVRGPCLGLRGPALLGLVVLSCF